MNKRILSALLALTLCACLTACSESENTSSAEEKSPETTAAEVERKAEIEPTVTDEETTDDETTTEDETTSSEESAEDPDDTATSEHKLHQLTTIQNFVSLKDENGFCFEVQLSPEEAAEGVEVGLYDDDGELVAEMLDNGENEPDKVAGDGLYSCYYKPEADGPTTYNMTAKIGDTETNTVRVRLYDTFTNEDFDKLREVTDEFNAITDKYKDASGNIPNDKKADALKEAEALAQQLYDDNEIIEYTVQKKGGSVWIWLNSALPYVYSTEPLE